MNFSITSTVDPEHIDDETIYYNKINLQDLVDNRLSQADIVSAIRESTSVEDEFIIFGFCIDESGQNVVAIFKIKSLAKKGKFYNITLQRINDHEGDNNELNFEAGNFGCSIEDYVYDIPSGDSVGAANTLFAKALVYAQKHQPRHFVDVIKTSDIITDSEATEQNKKYYFELQHTPIKDELAYLEINGVNYYEASDDIEIDRENKRIYFDTQEDDFSFENLQDSAETVRVFYKYIPE